MRSTRGWSMLRISGYRPDRPVPRPPGFGVVGRGDGRPAPPHRRAGPHAGALRRVDRRHAGRAARRDRRAARAAPPRRARRRRARCIDVALHEAVFNVMESLLPEYSAFGAVREAAGSALPGIAPSNAYRCADGYVLVAGNGDSIFKRLMRVIGRDDLARRSGARAQRRPRRARRRDSTRRSAPGARPQPVDRGRSSALDAARVPAGKRLHRRGHRRATRTTGRAT